MNNETIIQLTQTLQNCKSSSDVMRAENKYSGFEHPYKYFVLASFYQTFRDQFNAKKNLIQAIKSGINNISLYRNTMFADSIGSSIAYLVVDYNLDQIEFKKRYNLFVTGYILLSESIMTFEKMGGLPFETYRNRADMLYKHQGSDPMKSLTTFLMINSLGPSSIASVVVCSDYFSSAKCYLSASMNDDYYTYINKAKNIWNDLEDISIGGRDADEYNQNEIVDLGKKRHQIIYNNLIEKFNSGEFNIDSQSLQDML